MSAWPDVFRFANARSRSFSDNARMRKLLFLLALMSVAAATTDHGLDLAGMDRKVRPGDDFFTFANGGWLAATQIPADRSNWGVFATLAEKADKRTADLIRGTKNKKISDYYAAYMDEAAIEKKGLHPLDDELAALRAIKSKTDIARVEEQEDFRLLRRVHGRGVVVGNLL